MNFNPICKIFFSGLLILVAACSDPDNEIKLVDLHTIASQDLVSIDFSAETEDTVSIDSVTDFTVVGTKSNGLDTFTISDNIEWSLSQGADSTIDQQGHFSASQNAESIVLTAKVGILSKSIDIKVSSATFDQVVQLNTQSFDINMCQSQIIKPMGRYVDESNNDEIEIRTVDSNIISTIDWTVTNKEDDSEPQRASVEKLINQTTLHTRARGNIVVHATVFSQLSETDVTSSFDQSITSGELEADNEIKICNSDDGDLNTCRVTSVNVEQDKVISLIAVGKYQDSDGSDFYQNISRNSQWGISNVENASLVFSSDRQQIDVTGDKEEFSTTISVACGHINESLDEVDISQGVILDDPVSCVSSSSIECQHASTVVIIDRLSVLSFEVSANDIDLTDNVSLNFDTHPDEINLIVKANFSNDTLVDITDDVGLSFSIIVVDGEAEVIQETDTDGLFTVVGVGTAKIQLDYRGEKFIILIEVP